MECMIPPNIGMMYVSTNWVIFLVYPETQNFKTLVLMTACVKWEVSFKITFFFFFF